jgi:hypothetical protein
MLEHRSRSLDGPDNTCRKFEHRVQSPRGRQQERLDCGSILPVRMVQHRFATPTKLTLSRQDFYLFPTTVRSSFRHLLTEDCAAELHFHLLRRFSRGFTRADRNADYCIPRFDGCWRRRFDDSCSDYRFGCGDFKGKVGQRSLDSKDFLANAYAPQGESIRAYWYDPFVQSCRLSNMLTGNTGRCSCAFEWYRPNRWCEP